jgi:hypothetical protein
MELVAVLCPDCGQNIGSVEETERGLVVKARIRDFPMKQLFGVPELREHKAKTGRRIRPTPRFVTLPLAPTGPPTAFECPKPKHGYFELPDADLRDAALRARAERKRIRLPAHRP